MSRFCRIVSDSQGTPHRKHRNTGKTSPDFTKLVISLGGDTTKKKIATTLALLLSLTAVSFTQPASAQTAGFTTLFDGKSLTGWDMVGNANWRIEDGAAVADKGNGFLVTQKDYKNFSLRAEFWVGPDANSGIFVHCTDTKDIGTKTAYEVNIWDDRPEKDYATGAVVGIAKVDPMPKTIGKWSVYEITLNNGVFTVAIDGKKTVDGAKDTKFANGRIALQHGLGLKDAAGVANDKGVVKFRKVEIKVLADGAASN